MDRLWLRRGRISVRRSSPSFFLRSVRFCGFLCARPGVTPMGARRPACGAAHRCLLECGRCDVHVRANLREIVDQLLAELGHLCLIRPILVPDGPSFGRTLAELWANFGETWPTVGQRRSATGGAIQGRGWSRPGDALCEWTGSEWSDAASNRQVWRDTQGVFVEWCCAR